MIANAVHTLADVYINRDNKKKTCFSGFLMHISVVFSWDLPPWCISFLATAQEFGSSHIQLRRASARQPNGAPRDHVLLASSSCKCKPIRCKLELHLCTVVSTTG